MADFSSIRIALGSAIGIALGWVVGTAVFDSLVVGGVFALAIGAVAGASALYLGGSSKYGRRAADGEQAGHETGDAREYDVGTFAKKYGLSERDAWQIMSEHGSSRQTLDQWMAARSAE
jgi:hypothetical protein